jgi:hypothetical protein
MPGGLPWRRSPRLAIMATSSPVFVTSKGWGTGWGGYVLLEVDDPKAFDHYQLFCNQNYGHVVHLTFEPLFDSDAALAETVSKLKR